MARRNENSRISRKAIYIVCEGTNTEPLFFASIRDRIIDGKYNIGDCEINIIPQPLEPADKASTGFTKSRGDYSAKKMRKAQKRGEIENEILNGPPPLNWVLTAQERLKGTNCDEAWVVFDKDGHPAMEEAFKRANDDIDGKKVNIAFSSRSFEYYLLLHFEDIFHEFNATECGARNSNGNKKPLDCMLESAKPGACQGDKCINGYARMKDYWKKTKNDKSTFALVEDKLNVGIVHANWLRFISDRVDEREIYERNPYVTVDKLVCRLTNTHVIEVGEVVELKYNGDLLKIHTLCDNTLIVKNLSNRTIILQKDFFLIFDAATNSLIPFGARRNLYPGHEELFLFNLSYSKAIVVNTQYVKENYIFLRNYKVDIWFFNRITCMNCT